jgi:hypothetical protein
MQIKTTMKHLFIHNRKTTIKKIISQEWWHMPICNPTTREAEAGGQETSLGYIVRPCFKKNKTTTKKSFIISAVKDAG